MTATRSALLFGLIVSVGFAFDALAAITPDAGPNPATEVDTPASAIEQATETFWQLLETGEYQQKQGQFQDAKALFSQALSLAETLNDAVKTAAAMNALGNSLIVTGPPLQAYEQLTQALTLAQQHNQTELAARIFINLGNLYSFQQNPDQAARAYQQSIFLASQAENPLLISQALANAARLAVSLESPQQTLSAVQQAAAKLAQLPNAADITDLSINLAGTLLRLPSPGLEQDSGVLLAYRLLEQAVRSSKQSGDTRNLSHALGLQGSLYERERRYQEALQLTHQALFQAQTIDDRYLLSRWFWQKGRILKALQKNSGAIAAYRDSLRLLNGLRFNLVNAYQAPAEAFVESVAPVYSEFIELLLNQASKEPESTSKALVEARNTIEHLKAAEIRNYFGDECVDALQTKSTPLWKASTSALIVYPVLLADRMDLLLDFPDGRLTVKRVPVSLASLTEDIRLFRTLLEKRSTNEYRIPGKRLYNKLISPLLADLRNDDIQTLVFVPDGPLLTVPLAALYDGTSHLIEQFAIAVTPGVQLIDPQPLSGAQIKPVLGGISESVQGFPALTYVKDELHHIQDLYGGNLLLNKEFQTQSLEESLTDQNINLLHISTHAFLGENLESSYLLTFNGPLPIGKLADYVGLFKFRKTPLELLVLSACETAQSNERAALGLSGIAIRAGARSAIGSLWKVNDAATSLLMKEFYQSLNRPDISRAKALQLAQLAVMHDIRYRHPGYWSAFMLINNWL